MLKLAAIIVTYNRLNKLQITLRKTLEEEYVEAVIVINNASTDGTKAWLSNCKDERLIIFHNETNEGGAGGFAKGMEIALAETEADWFVLYDDDAYPAKGAFMEFCAQQELDSFDAGAAAVYYEDGTICEMNRPSWDPFRHFKIFCRIATNLFKPETSRSSFHVTNFQYNNTKNISIDCCSFVGFFISRNCAMNVPKINKELFIYSDDILYTLGLTKIEKTLIFIPKVKFIHNCLSNIKSNNIDIPLWKIYYIYRNSIIVYKYTAGFLFIFIFIIKFLEWIFRIKYCNNKIDYIKVLGIAVYDGLRNKLPKNRKF